MKFYKIVLFLFCLVFLLGPKTIWHGQAHNHDAKNTVIQKKLGETSFHEDCFSCDLDLGLFTSSGVFQFLIPIKTSFFNGCSLTVDLAFSIVQSNLLRGPPARI